MRAWLLTIALFFAYAAQAHGYVYWTDGAAGTIGRANLDGSGVVRDFITGASSPTGIAVDEHHIYWTDAWTGTIGRADLDGSDVDHHFITDLSSPTGLAVDGSYLYWTSPGAIGRASLDGAPVHHDFIIGEAGPTSVAVNDLGLYWTAEEGIRRANVDGSGVETVHPEAGVRGLAVDDWRIVWASETGIHLAALATIGIPDLLADVAAQSVAVDAQHVYWTTADAIDRTDLAIPPLIAAVNPVMLALDGGQSGTASASASSLDFGFASIGTLGRSRTLTITNTGPGTLEVEIARVTGTHAEDFLLGEDTCSGARLVIGEACTVDVVFVPDAVGDRQATLAIASNDAASPLEVELLGTGEDPDALWFDDFPEFDDEPEDFDDPPGIRERPRLRTCRIVRVKGGDRRRCRNRRLRGRPNFAAAGTVHATLTRRGVVYATGTARRSNVVLDAHRRVRPGRYTLTLRRANQVVRRIRITIRR